MQFTTAKKFIKSKKGGNMVQLKKRSANRNDQHKYDVLLQLLIDDRRMIMEDHFSGYGFLISVLLR